MDLEERILALLRELGIRYDMLEHRAVYTVAEARACGIHEFAGTSCKNLFLRSANAAQRRYYLVLIPDTKRADLKALAKVLGSGSRLGFASEEELWKHLSLRPGAVTPLAIVADDEGVVELVVDRELADRVVQAHPGVNTKTLALALHDVILFAERTGHRVHLVDIPAAGK